MSTSLPVPVNGLTMLLISREALAKSVMVLVEVILDVSIELEMVLGVGGSLNENNLGTSRFNASSKLRDALVTYFIPEKGGLWSLVVSLDISKLPEVVNYDEDRQRRILAV